MTLSNKDVRAWLGKHAVCGWTNIEKEEYAGSSNRHQPGQACKLINNGAGGRNVQMFFMTADGRVLNCLAGFWSPADWMAEADLALELDRIYRDRTLDATARNERFLQAHLACVRTARKGMDTESQLQPFDKHHESHGGSDFVRSTGLVNSETRLKSIHQVIHERMAERPYLPFERFDTARFADMGGDHYSYHLN